MLWGGREKRDRKRRGGGGVISANTFSRKGAWSGLHCNTTVPSCTDTEHLLTECLWGVYENLPLSNFLISCVFLLGVTDTDNGPCTQCQKSACYLECVTSAEGHQLHEFQTEARNDYRVETKRCPFQYNKTYKIKSLREISTFVLKQGHCYDVR